jgi:hypothetical protein
MEENKKYLVRRGKQGDSYVLSLRAKTGWIFPFSRGNLPLNQREDCFPQGCFAIVGKIILLAPVPVSFGNDILSRNEKKKDGQDKTFMVILSISFG